VTCCSASCCSSESCEMSAAGADMVVVHEEWQRPSGLSAHENTKVAHVMLGTALSPMTRRRLGSVHGRMPTSIAWPHLYLSNQPYSRTTLSCYRFCFSNSAINPSCARKRIFRLCTFALLLLNTAYIDTILSQRRPSHSPSIACAYPSHIIAPSSRLLLLSIQHPNCGFS
jgi:hypothetical protein